jgi:hypothetical protein
MLLGRNIWIRGAGGWEKDAYDGLDGRQPAVLERLAECVSQSGRAGATLLFEPEGLGHEEVETPKVNREVFAQLARVKSEHPVVESEDLGWGIEEPEPAPGGSYATLIHHETTPGLAHVRRASEAAGARITAAWSAYTAADSCLRSHLSGARPRIALILAPDFVAVATSGGGKRIFKAWSPPLSDRDWRGLAFLTGDLESRRTPLMADSELRRGRIGVISEGDPSRLCPIWNDIKSSGRLEVLLGMDALADAVGRIASRHPANLLEAFPRPLGLDRYLSAVALGSMAVATCAGLGAIGAKHRYQETRVANEAKAEAAAVRLAALAANRAEMDALRNEAPDTPGFFPGDRGGALQRIAEAIPDSLTLTSFSIARDDAFEIEALLVGKDLDADGVRQALVRSGFTPGTANGWLYDAASRRLSVRGRFGEVKP